MCLCVYVCVCVCVFVHSEARLIASRTVWTVLWGGERGGGEIFLMHHTRCASCIKLKADFNCKDSLLAFDHQNFVVTLQIYLTLTCNFVKILVFMYEHSLTRERGQRISVTKLKLNYCTVLFVFSFNLYNYDLVWTNVNAKWAKLVWIR